MTKELEERIAELERELNARKRTLKPANKKWKLYLVISTLFVLTVVSLLYFTVLKHSDGAKVSQQSIPGSIVESVDFPLHYPNTVPNGFKLDTASFKSNPEYVSFAFTSNTGKTLIVIEQAKPENFDPEKQSLEELSGTSIGKSYITELNYRSTGIILADHTMITISATEQYTDSDVKALMRGF